MNAALEALRSTFDAERVPNSPTGQSTVAKARSALRNAEGQLQLVEHTDDLTAAQSQAFSRAAAQLHAAARQLELLATAVDEHVRDGVSLWQGAAGREAPVLL